MRLVTLPLLVYWCLMAACLAGPQIWRLDDWARVAAPTGYTPGEPFTVSVELLEDDVAPHLHLDASKLKRDGQFGGFLKVLGRQEVAGPGVYEFQCVINREPDDLGLVNLTLYLTTNGKWDGRTRLGVMPLMPPGGRQQFWDNVAARVGGSSAKATTERSTTPGMPPMEVPAEIHAKWVQNAPAPDFDLAAAGLRGARLVDFIDCANPDDPHAMLDQGTSRVVDGPAGKYRLSAPHKHAFFAYGYQTAGPGKLTMLLIEYPDDAERVFNFWTHDQQRPSRPHWSFDPTAGVMSGGELPVSNEMRYLTFPHWPRNAWSPVIAVSQQRVGGGAAASRIWVYAVDELEPAIADAPENGRDLDLFFPTLFLADRDYFGWKDPDSFQNMADYLKWIGFNRATLITYANQKWGAMMTVPAWGIEDDERVLDDALSVFEKEGLGIVVGFVVEGMYGKFLAPDGRHFRELSPDEQRRMILDGFTQMIERYGKYRSFRGFALGSMETATFYDLLNQAGLVDDVIAHVRELRPDLEVSTYLGNARLQKHIFDDVTVSAPVGPKYEYRSPRPMDVVADWEANPRHWPEHLTAQVTKNYRNWNRRELIDREPGGLAVYELAQIDAHRLAGGYWGLPRTALLYDVWRGEALSQVVDTRHAAFFSFFDEGFLGLYEGMNFWHHKWWTAPEYNPPGPLAIRPWTLLQAHHDRVAISGGGWNVKTLGAEVPLRAFAQAFRSLPREMMQDIAVKGADTVVARWLRADGRRHIALVNRTPFSATVLVDGETKNLPPYGLAALEDDGKKAPQVAVQSPSIEPYVEWVRARLDHLANLIQQLRDIDPKAAPAAYADALAQARQLLPTRAWQADQAVGYGMVEELELRLRLLQGQPIRAPRIADAPPPGANLDAWPDAASDNRSADGSGLGRHTYFVNSWTGPDDLSARMRLANDGQRLYFGIEIRDQAEDDKDAVQLWLSRGEHRDWGPQRVKPEVRLFFNREPGEHRGSHGLQYLTYRIDGGWVFSGSLDLATLKLGQHPGILLYVNDVDDEPNLNSHSWALKQSLLLPHDANFTFWSDMRNGGNLIVE